MFPTFQRIDLGILAFIERWVTHPVERTFGVTNFALARLMVLYLLCLAFLITNGASTILHTFVLIFIGVVMISHIERGTNDARRKNCVSPVKSNPAMLLARFSWLFLFFPLTSWKLVLDRDILNLLALCGWLLIILLISLDSLPPGSECRLSKLLRTVFPRRTRTA